MRKGTEFKVYKEGYMGGFKKEKARENDVSIITRNQRNRTETKKEKHKYLMLHFVF